ncbi:MAG: DUF6371 domain-containing protein [Saprospiraceae bacterium]
MEIGKTLYRELPISISKLEAENQVSSVPIHIVNRTLNCYLRNHFVAFLYRLFHREMAAYLVNLYRIGTSKHWPGATVFWQIDRLGNVRTGKIMLYHPHTGKRVKEPQARISWAHTVLRLPDFQLAQCLFGEHQLQIGNTGKKVALVESEKTAVLMSGLLPDYIWLATGGLHNLSTTKCQCLKNQDVVLFPDLNSYDKWCAKAPELQAHCKQLYVSDLLERKAAESDRIHGLDLADYLVKCDEKAGWALTEYGYPLFWDFTGSSINNAGEFAVKRPHNIRITL